MIAHCRLDFGSGQITDRRFEERFPDRFYNVNRGNMFGIASGMAKCGLIPFTSCFIIFTACRGWIKSYRYMLSESQRQNDRLHAGTSFGQAGCTIPPGTAIMRSMANLTIIVPADGLETASAVKAAIEMNGLYISESTAALIRSSTMEWIMVSKLASCSIDGWHG